jgi:hypothetical protein
MERSEIGRLIELMPASGRMYCKIISNPQQSTVIAAKFPRPGQETRPIQINLELWHKLSQPQRDLLLLHTVSWLTGIRWFQPDLYLGLAAAGASVGSIELLLGNAAGVVTFGGLTAVAIAQIWRKNRSNQNQVIADEKAVQVAQRRGYSQTEAVQALAEAIEAVAQIEGRTLTVNELLRCQTLRSAVPLAARSLQK